MLKTPTVTVLGTGYVGLTSAALFAAAGIKTYVVDPNQSRLDSVQSGKSFFYEAGLDPIISSVVRGGTLIPTASYETTVPESDIIISAVGTPDNPDGSSNLQYVFAAAAQAAGLMKPDAIFVQKSTVPVGTGKQVLRIFADKNITNAYVSNPEFLREGTALADSLWFDRIVVGGNNNQALEQVMALYKTVEAARDTIARIGSVSPPANRPQQTYMTVGLESAEMIKVVSNAFLALKISFANSIAPLADKAGADVSEVLHAVGADPRIGNAFLGSGRGYGGGCFPKDVSGLIAAGLAMGVDLEIMQAAQSVNESMPGYVVKKLQDALGGSLHGQHVAVLGLSFKAGTSDCRRSPAIHIANILISRGATVTAYDPKAAKEAAPMLRETVKLADTAEQALQDAQAVIVATEWPEFKTLPPETYARCMAGRIFIDAMNYCDRAAIAAAGLHYEGIGRSAV